MGISDFLNDIGQADCLQLMTESTHVNDHPVIDFVGKIDMQILELNVDGVALEQLSLLKTRGLAT